MRPTAPLIAVLLCFASLATAAPLPPPSVDYSADREIVTAQGDLVGRVYHAGGKERAEMEMGGMKMITIIRPDRQLIWTLMPMQKMYQELDFDDEPPMGPQLSAAPPQDMTISKVGSEKVEGHDTTKYQLTLADESASGFIWLTRDNIPVKMDMLSEDGGQKIRMQMTLKNLKIGKQDPALFELPAGYQKLPSMGGLMGR